MTDPAPRYLDTSQAARYLGISPKTLMRMRVTGDGPRYAKAGRRVIYDRLDLDGGSRNASAASRPSRRADEAPEGRNIALGKKIPWAWR